METGYAALSAQLAGGDWPVGTLIELLVAHPCIGEMRLLRPALAAPLTRSLALVQPPHVPHAHAYAYFGVDLVKPLWIRTAKSAEALWSAEQILRIDSCSVLVLWQNHIRAESLRRLPRHYFHAAHSQRAGRVARDIETRYPFGEGWDFSGLDQTKGTCASRTAVDPDAALAYFVKPASARARAGRRGVSRA